VPDTPPPENWPELASLVDTLLDTPPERRAALIAELSGGDVVRQSELENLLAECEREAPLLDRPAAERFGALFDDDVAPFPETLGKQYRLSGELGRGGMATVYLARDLKHGRDVAVKVVHPSLASAWGAERFLREIEIVAQLQHPNIVPLYDSGEANGSLYYVMPYEPGSSLRQRLVRDGRLTMGDAVLILRDVCDALAYAHERGIVHRDIKPDNVLLSGRHAMVTDFGVAKAATEAASAGTATATGIALGTPAYMAPEQIAAEPRIDHRADIYSLGVLAYELLAGKPPFGGEARQDILSAHLTEPPVPLSTHRDDVPAPLVELVMKCLEKRPADRWQSAEEVRQHLEALAVVQRERTTSRLSRWGTRAAVAAGAMVVATLGVAWWQRAGGTSSSWQDRWAGARIERLTDFAGSEVDASVSPNGQFVAFLADRDSVFDAFVTQVGTGQFSNLTGGRLPQLFNEDVRNIGFSGDAAHVWIRVADIASPASVSIVPTLGGPLRPFLKTAVMAVWSPDGSKLAYHETTPGDPIYVADRDGGNSRRIFVADPGIHCHHLSWSPDGRFLYFSYGIPPDEMDVWRIPSTGGPAQRITTHNSRVAYPALLDDRTLLYSATDDDGTGPWLYARDLDARTSQRLSNAVEHYISIAAAADAPGRPRRLVATVSNPSVNLWHVPITDGVVDEQAATRLALPTARSAAPRFNKDSSILYLASRGGADGLWRNSGVDAIELWKPTQGAVVGAAAVSPDGRTACFPVRRQGRSTLHCTASDGTGASSLADSLDVRGAASWSPDGKWLAVAAKVGTSVRLFKVPADGGPPVRLVDSVSTNPVWSPDGRFILYSGTPRARSAPLKAVTPEGRPYSIPSLSVDRVGDSYRFLPGSKRLVVKLGGFRRQDFWLFDLASGNRRQLTSLRPGESLNRFDVSPDGKRILFERVRENSDIVLIELPAR
jgi:Tol biopolymer transport system component